MNETIITIVALTAIVNLITALINLAIKATDIKKGGK